MVILPKIRRFYYQVREEAGKEVKLVDPYNTTQGCFNCGEIAKKTLADREHRCSCGYVEHRDINSAKNILKRGLLLTA